MAINFFFIHLLGDLPSPTLVGVMNETVGLHISMLLLASWLIFAVIFWTVGYFYARNYYTYEEE
jgi:hypothetical protein